MHIQDILRLYSLLDRACYYMIGKISSFSNAIDTKMNNRTDLK